MLGHMARNMTSIQLPPMLAWTPYQTLEKLSQLRVDTPNYCPPSHRSPIKSTPQTPVYSKAGSEV